MRRSYRFRLRASYARLGSLGLALAFGLVFSGCSEGQPLKPQGVFVGARIPSGWPSAASTGRDGAPQIQAMRFSTLDVALGSEWTGDAIASPTTTRIDVKTNLFDLTMPQTAPGRFHFTIHVLDLPAFLVRPYTLHVVARDKAGRETTTFVPFRIHGRV